MARRQGDVIADASEDRLALPVARLGHVVGVGEERRLLRSEHGADLVRGPDIGRAFLAVRVGVLAGGEGTAGDRHLAQQVVERVLDHLAIPRLAVTCQAWR